LQYLLTAQLEPLQRWWLYWQRLEAETAGTTDAAHADESSIRAAPVERNINTDYK